MVLLNKNFSSPLQEPLTKAKYNYLSFHFITIWITILLTGLKFYEKKTFL